jgi:ABC-2 type transport system ATP-binding protein
VCVIKTDNLTKDYGAIRALDGVSLTVPAGSIFGFLGPNGAGKTTALRILMGLLRPSGGVATILGRHAWKQATRIHAQVGYLPGDVRFPDWMTGEAFLAFCDRARGGRFRPEIDRLRDRFGLDLQRRIRGYSRGMRQKLGLIQALMHRPPVLILDEPTAGLDPLVRQTLYEELRAAVAAGQTVFFSSHALGEVDVLCDRVAIIRAGRIVEDSTLVRMRARALRRIAFRRRDGDVGPLEFPEGLIAETGADGTVRGSWKGPVGRLLPWLSSMGVEDLTIEAPSLEDLFKAYYHEDGAQRDDPHVPAGGRS